MDLAMDLAAELLAMVAADDAVRSRLAADGALFRAGYHPEMAALHTAHARRLAELVATHGWPGRTTVGAEAAAAAWRILQHAIGAPTLVGSLAPALMAAAARGEAAPAHAATLADRIAVYEGRLQRYGTQLDWDETLTAMVPMVGIEDPGRVDERRAAVGLPPLVWRRPVPAEQRAHRPVSWRARQVEFAAWAQATGWREAPRDAQPAPFPGDA